METCKLGKTSEGQQKKKTFSHLHISRRDVGGHVTIMFGRRRRGNIFEMILDGQQTQTDKSKRNSDTRFPRITSSELYTTQRKCLQITIVLS